VSICVTELADNNCGEKKRVTSAATAVVNEDEEQKWTDQVGAVGAVSAIGAVGAVGAVKEIRVIRATGALTSNTVH